MNSKSIRRFNIIKLRNRTAASFSVAILMAFVLVISTLPTTFAQTQVISINPIEDTHVESHKPTKNFGGQSYLEVDGSPFRIAYLKFDTTMLGATDNITSAILSLSITDSSSSEQIIKAVHDSSWDEFGMTYNTRTPLDEQLASMSNSSAGQVVTIDLTSYIQSKKGQILSVGIDSTGNNGLDFSSKEAVSGQPLLEISYDSNQTQASAPVFSPEPGTFQDSVDVSMHSSTFGSSIYYTTDGTSPTTSSTIYNGPVTITEDTTFQAIAVANGLDNSSVSSAAYTVVPTPPPTGTLVVSAADIAECGENGDEETAALLDSIFATETGFIATPGDHAYPDGTTADFACYDSSWGAHKAITYPAPGNHEYNTPGAAGYYTYFGARAGDPDKGYYSYDLDADWHAIVLNSSCGEAGGCDIGSPQEQWLRADLAAHADKNIFAYWHSPRYTQNSYNDDPDVDPLWDALYEYGAEFVLNGHEHHYERYRPLDNNDNPDDAFGIQEFIVGTGGKSVRPQLQAASPYSDIRNHTDLGVLKLRLEADSYSWEFVSVAGGTFTDFGSSPVHDAPAQLSAQAPILDPGSGTYSDSVYVSMSTTTPGGTMYYTTDGSIPTASSTAYTGPFILTESTTVNAITIAAGYSDSTVASEVYTIQASGGNTVFLEPTADAHVEINRPTRNYGTQDYLEIDNDSVKIAYFKFDLSLIPQNSVVTSATLKMTVTDSSSSDHFLKEVLDTSWGEDLLTYNNRPTGSALIASLIGNKNVGQVIEVDLTSAVDSNQGNIFSFLIDSTGSNGLDISSREASAGRPVLEITYQ